MADPVEQGVTKAHSFRDLLLGSISQGSKLIQVGTRDEIAGLSTPQDQASEISPLLKFADQSEKFHQHGLPKGIHLFIGKVERHQGDLSVGLFETECVGHAVNSLFMERGEWMTDGRWRRVEDG